MRHTGPGRRPELAPLAVVALRTKVRCNRGSWCGWCCWTSKADRGGSRRCQSWRIHLQRCCLIQKLHQWDIPPENRYCHATVGRVHGKDRGCCRSAIVRCPVDPYNCLCQEHIKDQVPVCVRNQGVRHTGPGRRPELTPLAVGALRTEVGCNRGNLCGWCCWTSKAHRGGSRRCQSWCIHLQRCCLIQKLHQWDIPPENRYCHATVGRVHSQDRGCCRSAIVRCPVDPYNCLCQEHTKG